MQEQINIRHLKEDLARQIRKVEDGTVILLMRRADLAAVLVPPSEFVRYQQMSQREGVLRAFLLGHGINLDAMDEDTLIRELHKRLTNSQSREASLDSSPLMASKEE